MNICRTSYELFINGKRVASWMLDRATPPTKSFARVPKDILAQAGLTGYSVRAKVMSCEGGNERYVVKLEAIPLNFN